MPVPPGAVPDVPPGAAAPAEEGCPAREVPVDPGSVPAPGWPLVPDLPGLVEVDPPGWLVLDPPARPGKPPLAVLPAPPRPPEDPVTVGPAVGIEPPCAVAAVSML